MKHAADTRCCVAITLALVLASSGGSAIAADEPVLGGPCEGCELVFDGMPAELESSARIAPPDEPGEPVVIEGPVVDAEGKPAAGIIVYAYHTDVEGIYPRGTTRHGRLRGWVITDDKGNYRFDTIRPAAYPRNTIPQHVHMHVIEPGRGTYYIESIHFEDDPLLTASERRRLGGRGGPGLVRPERDADGVWHVRRDITLGQNVPGYQDLD